MLCWFYIIYLKKRVKRFSINCVFEHYRAKIRFYSEFCNILPLFLYFESSFLPIRNYSGSCRLGFYVHIGRLAFVAYVLWSVSVVWPMILGLLDSCPFLRQGPIGSASGAVLALSLPDGRICNLLHRSCYAHMATLPWGPFAGGRV